MGGLRLALFDFDGTLVDSAGAVIATMQTAFAAHDLPPPSAEAVKAIIGLSLPNAVEALHQDGPLPPSLRDSVVGTYRATYHGAALAGTLCEPLYHGIEAMLDALDEPDTCLGIATGKSRRGLDRLLARHGLSARFVTTVTADDAASKPAPEMVLRALGESGVEAHRTVMIGDSSYDMQMARTAGAVPLGVAWGYQPRDRLLDAGAANVAETVADIPRLFDELCPR